MYSLLRQEGLAKNTAILGAFAFEAMPKLFAHYGAGHLTLLYAVPWMPWLLWASRSKPHDREARGGFPWEGLIFVTESARSRRSCATWKPLVAEAISNTSQVILLDDGLARRIAQTAGLPVWGTLKVLLEAKSLGLVGAIAPILVQLKGAGMWISDDVGRRILALAGRELPGAGFGSGM